MAAQSGFFSSGLTPAPQLRSRQAFITTKSNLVKCLAVATVQETPKELSPARPPKRILGSGTKLVGVGSAVPSKEVHNDDFSSYLDTSHQWIFPRTGIERRRVLSGDETLSGMAVEACSKALQMANVKPEEVDLLLLCSSTPEDLFGSAPEVQRQLGCKQALSFDVTAACSGFILGMVTATRFIKGGGYKNALVVGADALSRFVDWEDRGTCILFGDGAGAVLLQACSEDQDSLLGFDMHTDGDGQKHLHCKIELSNEEKLRKSKSEEKRPEERMKSFYRYIEMNGKEVFRFAVRAVPQVVEAALEEAGLEGRDVDWLLLHQANQRILDAVSERLKIPNERVISNLINYGNTSAASVPLALDEAVRSGRVKAGDVIASAGFGAGLTWASAIFKWG